MPRITLGNLDAVLAAGESQTVEFKASVPAPRALARTMAGMANAQGGSIILGLNDRVTEIRPVDLAEARGSHLEARQLLSPEPATDIYWLDTMRGRLVVIDVDPSKAGPTLADGVVLLRREKATRAADRADIVGILTRDSVGTRAAKPALIEGVAESLAAQSRLIEEIRTHQLEADSPTSRWAGYLISSLVGAAITLVLTFILS